MTSKNSDIAYTPKNKIRILTAASLFDGHDVSINIMRRIMQSSGAEVIHLGHNRSAHEIVSCALQEDVQGIAITSYQGGHLEFFKYIHDLLQEYGASHIKLFGGGGGTILKSEINELHEYGICRIFSPDDGSRMGMQGMIDEVIKACDFETIKPPFKKNLLNNLTIHNKYQIAKLISLTENHESTISALNEALNHGNDKERKIPVIGITGTGGSGKSTLTDEVVKRYLMVYKQKSLALLSVDPSRRKTGGALLGDRIRMNAIYDERVYMRSMATRQSHLSVNAHIGECIQICKAAGFDMIIVETSGIGQSDTEITDLTDVSVYVMTSEFGAATQLEKIDMLDFAHLVAINKFDKRGSEDALRDVRKQYRRNHMLWNEPEDALPVYGTVASHFNDAGTWKFFHALMKEVSAISSLKAFAPADDMLAWGNEKAQIVPPERMQYLDEICRINRQYQEFVDRQSSKASTLYQLNGTVEYLKKLKAGNQLPADWGTEQADDIIHNLNQVYNYEAESMDQESRTVMYNWKFLKEKYHAEYLTYKVRNKDIHKPLYINSLSGTRIPRVALPEYNDWGDLLKWRFTENVPGKFPYAGGVYPLRREEEEPTRMFAGEGGPEKTNKRFHYLSYGVAAKRLSTAFDSVTLYGHDPDYRPDIYGKIGNSGVSIAKLDDMKKLFSGFNLADPKTSVSMTINGPSPMILAYFFNAAIDQQCELYIQSNGMEAEVKEKIRNRYRDNNALRPEYQGTLPEGNDGLGLMLLGITGDEVLDTETYESIKADTLSKVRGTVQADILKEDQAQNTCIFSTEFALKMMGDIQQYFIDRHINNFYSVSISGYHIAEAGANPVTQLAFTLANGFTYVEYYLSRGMHIDDFAPNLSFFFSNGMDIEYAVIGRVARRIWAKAIKHKYGGNERSQKLKYHIQTSGRSLHAQEIAFNDIRTTLQALYALYDNCNSLHTNAYDEAITTPTEESVRRAMAIQLIINQELGLNKNENPMQGSFVIEELTDLVEEAVLEVFNKISERGGVLGAMENRYQRSRIQEESMVYESKKQSGELPVVGVNTFLNNNNDAAGRITDDKLSRSSGEEKNNAVESLKSFQKKHKSNAKNALETLKYTALNNENIFTTLMETTKHCTLEQITRALFEVGGAYRRNM